MLPRRPQRQTDHVFTIRDTMFTPERSFSFFCGRGGRKVMRSALLSLCSGFAYSLPWVEIQNCKFDALVALKKQSGMVQHLLNHRQKRGS